jgi:hypothetical protein
MITTHDEPKEKFKVVIEESKPGEPNPGDWIDKQFKADLQEPAPGKKAGRPKKSE